MHERHWRECRISSAKDSRVGRVEHVLRFSDRSISLTLISGCGPQRTSTVVPRTQVYMILTTRAQMSSNKQHPSGT